MSSSECGMSNNFSIEPTRGEKRITDMNSEDDGHFLSFNIVLSNNAN